MDLPPASASAAPKVEDTREGRPAPGTGEATRDVKAAATGAEKSRDAKTAPPKTEEPRASKPAATPAAPRAPKAAATPAKPPAKTASAPVEKESAQKNGPAAAAPAKPSEPALDLKSLEARLRDTDAIGVMTKLTLKSQVDDLLERFRAYHDGRAKMPLAELRQPYDSLILKVLALLQDKDPPLAGAISASREAIWSILADGARFSKL